MTVSTRLGVFAMAALLGLVIACGGGDEPAAPSLSPSATPAPVATLTPTPPPLPTVVPPPTFDLADYRNGDEVANLMVGLGPERPFPPELLDDAPELPKEEAATRWKEFLTETRVFELRIGEIWSVIDYCQKTGTLQYSPNKPHGGNWFVGLHFTWDVKSTEYSEWNKPRLVWPNPVGLERAAFVNRSYSGVSGGRLLPPDEGGSPSMSGVDTRDVALRAFDHPGCEEIPPVREFSAAQWEVLGLGVRRSILDKIDPEEPQLDPDEAIRRWTETANNITVFFNLNGTPISVYCANGTGIHIGRYVRKARYGITFRWQMIDASAVARNAVWLVWRFDEPLRDEQRILLELEAELDPYIAFLVVENPDCSIEEGRKYIESVNLDAE